MSAFRTYAGLIAALIVAAIGAVLLSSARLPALFLLVLGLATAGWWIWKLRQERQDPYDLKRLWDAPPEPIDEPDDEDTVEDDGTLFCHHCGHAVPYPLRVCPECGNPLG